MFDSAGFCVSFCGLNIKRLLSNLRIRALPVALASWSMAIFYTWNDNLQVQNTIVQYCRYFSSVIQGQYQATAHIDDNYWMKKSSIRTHIEAIIVLQLWGEKRSSYMFITCLTLENFRGQLLLLTYSQGTEPWTPWNVDTC